MKLPNPTPGKWIADPALTKKFDNYDKAKSWADGVEITSYKTSDAPTIRIRARKDGTFDVLLKFFTPDKTT